jgi:DNA-nicking Smr family endonuclease
MDFGKILEQWENGRKGRGKKRHTEGSSSNEIGEALDMDSLLARYPPDPGLNGPSRDPDAGEMRRESQYQRLRRREPQAELDLHGMTVVEAKAALERFLRDSRARGLEKVLIIHGKGHHSHGNPVLEMTVRAWLESSSLAGAFGRAERRYGGSGATWVIVRAPGSYRSR